MSGAGSTHPDRAAELLADKAMLGLSPAEAAELSSLLGGSGRADGAEGEAMELAAAALDLAMHPGPYEAMPASLRATIERAAPGAISGAAGARDVAGRIGSDSGRSSAAFAWLAAAACLALALTAWWPRVSGPAAAGTDQAYQQLVTQAKDLTRADWKAMGELEKTPVKGEVVWSSDRQEGYMVFSGLPTNAPTREQYQLWIFDPTQSDKTPIDGGVFDIPPTSDGRVIIPIDPKLHAQGPTLFAITIEKPGGVVVSDRSRLVLIAQPG